MTRNRSHEDHSGRTPLSPVIMHISLCNVNSSLFVVLSHLAVLHLHYHHSHLLSIIQSHSVFHFRLRRLLAVPQILPTMDFSPSTGMMSWIHTIFQIFSLFHGHTCMAAWQAITFYSSTVVNFFSEHHAGSQHYWFNIARLVIKCHNNLCQSI